MFIGIAIALWPLGQKAYGVWSQRELEAQWEQTTRGTSKKADAKRETQDVKTKSQSSRVSFSTSGSGSRKPVAPWPMTRISIPDIGVNAVVVQGLDEKSLARGPGHDPNSALPGQPGNCVIAGHRNVYGAWFYRLDELWAGSKIELQTPDGNATYYVVSVRTVSESDGSVRLPPTEPNARPRLTLITCTLPHTPNRIIVTAEHSDEPLF
jgi:LPXTG-site transpeptidase (sortase) family protein